MIKVKKSQSMPLNIIVTAIIFIVVLVMVIVYFTMNFWEQGDTITGSAPDCSKSNQIIEQMGIQKVSTCVEGDADSSDDGCEAGAEGKKTGNCASGWIRITGVTVKDGVCCGQK